MMIKKLDKYFSLKRNFQLFSLFAVSIILILLCYSLLLTQKVNLLSDEVKIDNDFISNLQQQSRDTKALLNATPEPTDDWKTISIPQWNLTFKCLPKWNCANTKIKNGYVTISQSTAVDITFYLINAKTLNHPYYSQASSWLSDFIDKKPITIEKIDGTQKPGYEGYIWPFYTNFNLNSFSKIIINNDVAVVTTTPVDVNKVILVPWGNDVLKIDTSNVSLTDPKFQTFLSTIHRE